MTYNPPDTSDDWKKTDNQKFIDRIEGLSKEEAFQLLLEEGRKRMEEKKKGKK